MVENNTVTFAEGWTGTGTTDNTGDNETICVMRNQYMQSQIVYTGTIKTRLTQNKYLPGANLALKYRTGATDIECQAASWNNYTEPFSSLGYVQVRVEFP